MLILRFRVLSTKSKHFILKCQSPDFGEIEFLIFWRILLLTYIITGFRIIHGNVGRPSCYPYRFCRRNITKTRHNRTENQPSTTMINAMSKSNIKQHTNTLTHLRLIFHLYINQSSNLQGKSINWFLYGWNIRLKWKMVPRE